MSILIDYNYKHFSYIRRNPQNAIRSINRQWKRPEDLILGRLTGCEDRPTNYEKRSWEQANACFFIAFSFKSLAHNSSVTFDFISQISRKIQKKQEKHKGPSRSGRYCYKCNWPVCLNYKRAAVRVRHTQMVSKTHIYILPPYFSESKQTKLKQKLFYLQMESINTLFRFFPRILFNIR